MAGKWITKAQVKIYMKARTQSNTQELSSAKAGISVRSGRKIEQDKRHDPTAKPRQYRTRKDPLASVWESQLISMLETAPELQAITLLEYLQSKYPGQYDDSILRTLQRRVKQWRATSGPEKAVMFRQEHPPGQQGLSDFTKLKRATITIAGQPFNHLLYHFRLIFSKWSYMKVIIGGESFTALASSLREALERLGGAPTEHRTDSLSAAYKNLNKDEQQDITERYQQLCAHYGMNASRNNRGCGHENGGVESPHGHLKRRIEQALLLRGNTDFDSIESYQAFIEGVVYQHNQRNAKAISVERQSLQALPKQQGIDYTDVRAVVSSSSTIDVRKVTYTVPSRLQSETLQVRLYDRRLVCYLGSEEIITLPRIYPISKTSRARLVDYKHVIHSLVKKPQAFRYSQLRDDLLPSLVYRTIWQYVNKTMDARLACKFMVGLLYLAATQDCESALAQTVLTKIKHHHPLSLASLQTQFKKTAVPTPNVKVEQHILSDYNKIIPTQQEVIHV